MSQKVLRQYATAARTHLESLVAYADRLDRATHTTQQRLLKSLAAFYVFAFVGFQPVAAQSAGQGLAAFCNSPAWGFVEFMFYLIVAIGLLVILSSIAAGAGLKSLGSLSRSIGGIGNSLILGSVAGILVFVLLISVYLVSYGYMPIEVPQSCRPI